MNSRVVHGVVMASIVTVFLVGTAQRGVAQQVVASSDTPRAGNVSRVFERKVSIRANAQSLKSVVNAMAESARVRIQYQDEIFEQVNPRVTIVATDIMLGDALRRVFSGTSLRAVALAPDYISIEPVGVAARSLAQGTVTGVVRDSKTGKPVADATITTDSVQKIVKTDADGTFQLTLSAGEHVIHVRALGFVRQSKRVTATEHETVALEFPLEPSASVLNEVVVTGTVVATERKAIPNPITVITAEEIERRGITRIDQFFRGEVPGITALDYGSMAYSDNLGGMAASNLYARGASGLGSNGNFPGRENPLKTYVDGVELLDASALGLIDPQSIERIEIVTGPQAATLYGSGALGGVMQIFTKRGARQSRPDVTATLRYGVMQSNISSGLTPVHRHGINATGQALPGLTYAGNLSYNYSGQWRPGLFSRQMGGSFGATYSGGAVTIGVNASVSSGKNGTWVDNFGNKLMLRERVAAGEWYYSNSTFREPHRVSTSANQTFSLNADYRVSSAWQHHLTIGRNQTEYQLEPVSPSLGRPADTLYSASRKVGKRNTLAYNMTLLPRQFSRLSSVITSGLNGSTSDQVTIEGWQQSRDATSYLSTATISATMAPKADSWGGFTSLRVGLFNQLYMTTGIRGEYNPAYGKAHKVDWTPTYGLSYALEWDALTVKAIGSYGRATKAPTPDMRQELLRFDLAYDPESWITRFENNTLTPEYSRGPQWGIEAYYGNRGSLTINRYRQEVTDLIQVVGLVDSILVRRRSDNQDIWMYQSQYQNTATVKNHGWESTASLNLAGLVVKGTYSWTDSRVKYVNPQSSGSGTYYPGKSFLNFPSHTGNFNVTYAVQGTSVALSTSWIGASPRRLGDFIEYNLNNYSRLQAYTERNRWDGANRTMPGYTRTNLTMSQHVAKSVSLRLDVQNLGNNYTAESSVLDPTLGRQTLVGVTLRYP